MKIYNENMMLEEKKCIVNERIPHRGEKQYDMRYARRIMAHNKRGTMT